MTTAPDNSPPPPGCSWRNIRQEVRPAMSRQGRRRQLAAWSKGLALSAFVAGGAWGIYELAHAWSTDRAALTTAVHSRLVRGIRLEKSDGVLTREWVEGVLALPKQASLMELKLPALRDKLLQSGQVRLAVLARDFNEDTLVVTLQERTPVVRLTATDGSGLARDFLVAKDGVVYVGVNYDAQLLAGLPELTGVRTVPAGKGFEPIAGMDEVSALLSTAQLEAPHLYRQWQEVSIERLAGRAEILVKAKDLPEIIFSRTRDYYKQIARLDYVIDEARGLESAPALQSVNLSLEGQVPVRLQSATAQVQTPVAAPKAPAFSLQPSQPKPNREF